MALFSVTILTALAVAFVSIARTDALLAGNRRARLQALYAAQSCVHYCRCVLASDDPSLDWAGEDWALVQDEALALSIPGFVLDAILTDESSRLNINTATAEMLTRLPGMTEEAADSILDWRDPDDEPRPSGAESDYYWGLPSPYEAANGQIETLEELRLVRGIDSLMLAGEGTQEAPGIASFLTVRSGEPNVDREGRQRLNVNSAGPEQLTARLGDILSEEEIAAITRGRSEGQFASLGRVLEIEGVNWRRMAQALDRLCVDDGTFIEGTVNLNTAGPEVLEAIGLPPTAVQALVEMRDGSPLASKAELAELPGVTREVMLGLIDHVATKSSLFRVTARAQSEDRPTVVGVIALLDRSAQPARIVLWQEHTGWLGQTT